MNKAKKIFAGWLILAAFGSPINMSIRDGLTAGIIGALLALPFGLLGWWLWRSLPPWKDL